MLIEQRHHVMAVHIGNAGPVSALDGYRPRKSWRLPAGDAVAAAILSPSILAVAICFVRWWLQ